MIYSKYFSTETSMTPIQIDNIKPFAELKISLFPE